MLKRLGIVKKNSKASSLFIDSIEPNFLNNEMRPSEYVNFCWDRYNASPQENRNNALNGKIFELIISTLFVKERILPLFLQAKVAFVPNVIFDAVLYSPECGPIAFSMKTSLRERYKQADLEGIALKYVHRKSKCYLFTMSADEADSITNKIRNGEVLGIDKIVLTTDNQFDDFISDLKQKTFTAPGKVDIIDSGGVITVEKINELITSNE